MMESTREEILEEFMKKVEDGLSKYGDTYQIEKRLLLPWLRELAKESLKNKNKIS